MKPPRFLATVQRNILIAAGAVSLAALILVGVIVAAVVVSGEDGDSVAIAPTETPSPRPSPSVTPSPSPQPSSTPEPTATPLPIVPGMNPEDRIVIARANVNAPITLKAVPPSGGALPDPEGPDDVVFYDFTGFEGLGGYPGSGGTLVLSGHVDYGRGPCKNGTVPPPCTAVFWDLTELKQDDVIELHLSDGVHRYRVIGSENIGPTDQAKWDNVWKASEEGERIALITCGGDFNRQTREYDSRHVVYGERIEAEA